LGAIFQGDELLIILVILLLILGPTKLPALARGLGQAVREFRKASSGLYDEEPPGPQTQTLTSPSPPKGLAPTATATTVAQAGGAATATMTKTGEVDDALLKALAEKLGISTEGKSREELKAEVLEKAKEKGLL